MKEMLELGCFWIIVKQEYFSLHECKWNLNLYKMFQYQGYKLLRSSRAHYNKQFLFKKSDQIRVRLISAFFVHNVNAIMRIFDWNLKQVYFALCESFYNIPIAIAISIPIVIMEMATIHIQTTMKWTRHIVKCSWYCYCIW